MRLEKNLNHPIITTFRGWFIISNWASNCDADSRHKKREEKQTSV